MVLGLPLLLVLLFVLEAQAQNVIQNPGFTGGLTNWTPLAGGNSTIGWDGSMGNAAPGSAVFTVTSPASATDFYVLKQCVPVSGSRAYDVSGSGRYSSGSSVVPDLSLVFSYYSDAACATPVGGSDGFGLTFSATPADAWVTSNYPNGLTTPSGAHSALLYLRITTFAMGTASGWFDDISLSPTPVADLSITKTDGHESAVPGTQITYTIVASNAGPSAANGAIVTDTVPGTLTSVSWTCVAAGGATCTASGSGSILQGVNLPMGGSVTYTLTGTISPSATGTLSNTATIAVPSGVADPNPANNTSTDTDTLVLMGGPLPGPLPLLPGNNWWNLDVSSAPVDPNSANFINFIGSSTPAHPDFGGDVSPGSVQVYGFPYAVVSGTQAKKTVTFATPGESDGVDHTSGLSFPFYPIPDLAITQPHWIEGGDPGNVDLRASQDRHLLIVDADNRYLYELYNVFYDTGTARWLAGSGAFFDLNKNHRRPETWTSADAAGLAMLPGLVRYDEAFGAAEIGHAFRVTVSATNGYVYPASHTAGSTGGAPPMGARLRLKAAKDISSYTPEVQRIFRAMKKYGLIVADNGTSMYVSGTYDTRWNNSVLNPAFGALTANDFEVVQLGFGVPTELKLADFDGDRQTDLAVFQTASGLWYIRQSSTGSTTSLGYGGSAYVPVPADYDGDGKADIAVYHPPTGLWFIRSSSTGTDSSMGFGGTGYAPVRGDFDGDGKADLAVFHDASGLWFIKYSSTGAVVTVGYGGSGYIPVPGDYDGDGKTDIAVYHPPTGLWFIRNSSTLATTTVGFGGTGYTPVRGDFDGDGKTDIAVYHSASGLWFIRNSSTLATTTIGFGGTGYTPVPADYDADGQTDIAVYHQASGLWFIRQSTTGTTLTPGFGGSGYVPVN
jgi:uncharacterized repeat protein (TIGR01451 family)